MPKDLIERTDAPPAVLDDLARRINTSHLAAMRAAGAAIECAIECGRALIEAKALVGHGNWLPWLQANTTVSYRTASRWMRFADNAEVLLGKLDTMADLTFGEADRLLAAPPKLSSDPDFQRTAESIANLRSHAAELAREYERLADLERWIMEAEARGREAKALREKLDSIEEELVAGHSTYPDDHRGLDERLKRHVINTWTAHGERIAVEPSWADDLPPSYADRCRRIWAMSAEERMLAVDAELAGT